MKLIDLPTLQTSFIKELEGQEKSFNTLKNYKTDLNIFNKYLTQKGRSLEINEITESQLKEYQNFLNEKYNSPNSIRRRIQALRIFFDYLIRSELLDHNPIKKMVIAPKIVDLPRPIPYSDILKLFDYINNQSSVSNHERLLKQRNLVLFTLIYGAGLKVSDIENLKETHINKTKDEYRIIIAPDKRDPYTTPIPKEYNQIIESYNELKDLAKQRDQVQFDDFLFNANPFKVLSGKLSSRGIEILFKDYSKALKLQLSAKQLRQSCIFKWLNQKLPVSRIKERMGVQPQYSLSPYEKLLKEYPHKYVFMEVGHE